MLGGSWLAALSATTAETTALRYYESPRTPTPTKTANGPFSFVQILSFKKFCKWEEHQSGAIFFSQVCCGKRAGRTVTKGSYLFPLLSPGFGTVGTRQGRDRWTWQEKSRERIAAEIAIFLSSPTLKVPACLL